MNKNGDQNEFVQVVCSIQIQNQLFQTFSAFHRVPLGQNSGLKKK